MSPNAPGRLRLFALFHWNLLFSSVEEEQRAEVVERCYRPLLDLAESRRLPLAMRSI